MLLAIAKQVEPESLKKGIVIFNTEQGVGKVMSNVTVSNVDYLIKEENLKWAQEHQQEWVTAVSKQWKDVLTKISLGIGKIPYKNKVIIRKVTPGLVLIGKRFKTEGGDAR